MRGTVEPMDEPTVVDEINRLLDADDETTVNTSMRLPTALRDAAALAVEHLGVASSTTMMTAGALRQARAGDRGDDRGVPVEITDNCMMIS